MFLKTNEEIKYISDLSDVQKSFSIKNESEVSEELLSSLFKEDVNGTHINLKYAPINNFELKIKDNQINILGENDKELIMGLYYLKSILNSKKNIRSQIIHDYPKYSHREFSLDVARNYFEIEEIKKIINELAMNRINYLHLHFSDDQNFSIQSDIYPLLNTKRQYSKKEIRELVKYAHERGIEIIPEIDLPGHMTHILNAYPDLRCNANIKSNVMCLKKENLNFVFNLIDEINELFSGEYFHFGCDELDLRSNKKCNDCLKKDKKSLEIFINSVASHIFNNNKKPIAWNDALQYGSLNENIIIQKWIDYHNDKKIKTEYYNGREFIIGSTLDTYFDYPYSIIPLKKTYEFVPSIKGIEAKQILGISSHIWNENINNNNDLEIHIFPRIQAFGENAWLNELDYNDFKKRLSSELERLKDINIDYKDIKELDKINSNEIVDFLLLKSNMKLYYKPNYIEGFYLVLSLLKNTQNNLEIAKDIKNLALKKYYNSI